MIRKRQIQSGFTILELMVATTVFSLVLIVCLASFLQVGRLFTKGVNMSLTQRDARTIVDSIANDIKFSQNPPIQPAANYFCVGLHRYKYTKNYHLGYGAAGGYGLIREDIGAGCPPVTTNGANPEEMLSNGMQLNDLAVGCGSGKCLVNINLVFYGVDNTVFTSTAHPGNTAAEHALASQDPDASCTGSLGGSQYCAAAPYTTTVLQNF